MTPTSAIVSSLVYIVLQINGKVIRVNGEAGPGIVEMATREKASYIVIGSRGLGQFRRTLLGSVSDYVLHHASVPVVVCKKDNGKD
jgi:nucleotide-binding universal stress UspA family protein